jgi:hypothetical protein
MHNFYIRTCFKEGRQGNCQQSAYAGPGHPQSWQPLGRPGLTLALLDKSQTFLDLCLLWACSSTGAYGGNDEKKEGRGTLMHLREVQTFLWKVQNWICWNNLTREDCKFMNRRLFMGARQNGKFKEGSNLGMVAQACNPDYLGGGDGEDCSSRPA